MAETTLASLKQNIAGAAQTFEAELKQAGSHWERKPDNSADGEGAWCARQVAEHIIGASGMFAAGIARATGLAMPGRTGGSYASADEAAAAFPGAHQELMNVINQLQESHLGIETEFGPLGNTNIERILGVTSYHLNDHAKQLKTLREG